MRFMLRRSSHTVKETEMIVIARMTEAKTWNVAHETT
jgi:hypothetical protein